MSNSKTGGVPASASAASMSSLPTTKILFRSKKNVELCAIDDVTNRSCDVLASGYSTFHVFHPTGNEVLIQFPSKGIVRCDLTRKKDSSSSSGSDIFLKESTRIGYCMYSPKGSYVLTWERAPPAPKKDSNVGGSGNGSGTGSGTGCTSTESSPVEFLNLKIWNGSTGEYLWGFPLKNLKREQWPPLQWTHDECFAFHMVTNHLHVYKGQDIFLHSSSTAPRYESRKIRCEGISSFSVPQSAVVIPTTTTNGGSVTSALDVVVKYLVSTFVAESKGKPAKLALLRYPDALGPASKSKPPVAAKSFYQAEECLVKWSPKGDAALVLTSTTVDSSGSSYYGSSNLYLLNASAGTCEPVPLPGEKNDGPVHDVAWMPNAQAKGPPIFAMLSGRMPALGSLHHGGTAQPTFLFGNAHRNTIAWSKHGRFVNLAGFGNLAGGMDFWDRNKCKPIPIYYSPTDYDKPSFGQTAPCAVGYGWSPNSRYFMVSTTSPRMNVDNGVKVFKYSGLQLANLPWDTNKYNPDQLLAADFVPTPFTDYPDRPQTPPPRRPKPGPDTAHHNNTNTNNNTAKHSNSHHPNSHHHAAKHDPTSTASTTTTESYVKPPGRYVPPAARRAAGGTTSLADRMRREREGNTMGPTKINSHNSLKLSGNQHNKKRLPVGMTVTSADMNTTNGSATAGGGKSKNALRRERQRQAKQKAALAAATATTTTTSNNNSNNEPTPPTTPAPKETVSPEKILKKLRKQLKQIEQLKEKDFDSLNEDQKEKLANEQQILKQLKSLKL